MTTRFACIADDAGEAQVVGDLECQLGGNVDVRRGTARLWNGHALGFEAVEMKRNCALHLSLDFLSRATGRDATRKVRRVGGVAGNGAFDDDQVFHESTSLSHDAWGARLRLIAINHDASPLGWSQNWSQRFSDAANHSRISTSKALQSLPWAQEVAGSNPVAPTTFRGSIPVPAFQRGSTHGALSCVSQAASVPPRRHTVTYKTKELALCWGLKRTRRLPVAEKTKSTPWT